MDNDIVGADTAPGGPHRVRVFSGNGEIEDADSPARELARAIEEIDGRSAIRMIFRQDRYGRGVDCRHLRSGAPCASAAERAKTIGASRDTGSPARGPSAHQ